MNFRDKVVMITGGTIGMGLCIVNRLLATDVEVVALFELETSETTKVFNDLRERHGSRIDFFPCDITNNSQLQECFDKIIDKYKNVDILVHSDFTGSEADPDYMMNLNYKSVVMSNLMMVERVGKHKGGKGGIIVNITSIAGLKTLFVPVYCSTKAAIVSFTRAIMEHFETTGVRVIALCPGVIDAPVVNSFQRGLDFIDIDEGFKSLPPKQSTENVATAFIDIVGKGKIGDVWVAEDDQSAYAVKNDNDYKKLRIN